jgi:hypothetical protein
LLRLDPASVDLTRPEVHPQPYGWPLAWTRSYGDRHVLHVKIGGLGTFFSTQFLM